MDRTRAPTIAAAETAAYGPAVLGGLKGFQRKTAEYVFERLYTIEDSTRRFLVADEVGLGKTLVAAGVIALTIDHLRARGTPRVDIIYICSNQAIARQNVDRIRHRLRIAVEPLAERITLLPYRLQALDQPVNLVALSPGTSFTAARAEGVVEERVILFRMLTRAWGGLGRSARQVFRGNLRTIARFREYESWIRDRRIDPGIVRRFRADVGGPGSPLHREFERVRDRIALRHDREARELRRTFVAKLRRILAGACLDALEPDLVILDEFQRFRDLLNPGTESGELAQHLFEYEDSHTQVRTLLLSATPYKMYTLSHETEDDHYRDFLETVRFLEGPRGSIRDLEASLCEFRSELTRAAAGRDFGGDAMHRLTEHGRQIQAALRRVMSRTERRSRGPQGDPMLTSTEMGVDLDADDVEAFLQAREIADNIGAPGVMEYWKSSPYLLSFMDQYQLSKSVRAAVDAEPNGPVARLVRQSPRLQFPRHSVRERRLVPGGNGRMRALMRDLAGSRLHHLLWLPPSLPTHRLGRDFELTRTATKRLVFSSWAMVPRAIAVLASYDAERRFIPESARADRYEGQLLNLTGTAFSVAALAIPSATLAMAGNPLRYASSDGRELVRAIEEHLRPKVDEITCDAATAGPTQEIWYAVAPLLLDGQSREPVDWLQDPPVPPRITERDDSDPTAWQTLRARILQGLTDPSALGRPPRDLPAVMAALAAGSPANATLRALSGITGTSPIDCESKRHAMRAAWAFRSLFRAPTSEGLLRNIYEPQVPVGQGEYWRRVLAYALEGGLSCVLDEYFHVTREPSGGEAKAADLVDKLTQALRLAAGRLDVVQWENEATGVERVTNPMRQHFARRYANDSRGDADRQASEHLDAVRAAFNSPFWPFVLSTTSVGQEGLDFHWYCHAVVHWNLPPNPVDLEQREGRVHRYHGHAIRKNIAQAVGPEVCERARSAAANDQCRSVWDMAYQLADEQFADGGGLVPHWVFAEGNARIQRHTPILPLSREADRIAALRRSLAVYRMVFGQPRQDDLLDFLLREVPDERRDGVAAALTIDLSPPT